MATLTDYRSFIHSKSQFGSGSGFAPIWMPSFLFDFQGSVTDWLLQMGRAAAFLDCGLGKSAIELVWAENVVRHTNKPVLLLDYLPVVRQMLREAEKFGVDAVRSDDGVFKSGSRVVVANYERLHYFDPDQFSGIVCDESSCLKNFDGKRKAQITEFARTLPYRMLGTATAAPNDYIELGTSSEALGEMGYMDMLSRFFVNDNNTSDTRARWRGFGAPRQLEQAKWRFKGHAQQHFWKWVCSWARAARKPSDLGAFSDERFVLPELIEREYIVESSTLPDGALFAVAASNMREEREERRRTITERCEKAAELVSSTGKSAVVWCHLNDEGDHLERIIPDGKQIAGKTPDGEKEELFDAFATGQLRVLAIKDKIGAWGLNWQHCDHVVRFATHSYESHYQAVRRCWRFGQKNAVTVDLIASKGERGIKANLDRKSAAADQMFTELVAHMRDAERIEKREFEKKVEVPGWLKRK